MQTPQCYWQNGVPSFGFLISLIKELKSRPGSLKTILSNFKEKKNNNNRTGKMEIQTVARRRGDGEKDVPFLHGGEKQ